MKKSNVLWLIFSKNKRQQFFRVMRLIGILCVCFTCTLSATVTAQQKLSMKLGETSIKTVFEEIRRQTNRIVIYNDDRLALRQKVNADFENLELKEVLDRILVGSNMTYRFVDDYIVIVPAAKMGRDSSITRYTIKGKVVDKRGEPVPGVTVRLDSTTLGTATDLNGEFSLTLSMNKGTLVFSFIGMKTRKVAYTGQKSLHVVMEEDATEVEEVVVNGYFSKSKESFTGNVVSVSKEELAKVSSNNLISALQVFDPSFRLRENVDMGSDPNSLPDFRIRGNSGFGTGRVSEASLRNDPNLPTFILDGYEVNVEKIFDLNIDRIENVTILKDASATAIYGSRAANGVVVVTTKAPEPGQLRVAYNLNVAITAPDLSDYDLMNAREKLQAELDAGLYDSDDISSQQLLRMDYAERLERVQKGVNTYWLSKPLEIAVGHKHSLYVEGGDQSVRYGIDLNYQANPGVMKKSERDRFGVGFLLSYNLNNKLLFRNKLTVDKMKANGSPYGSFREFGKANPYEQAYDEDGHLILSFQPHVATSRRFPNPLYESTLNHKDFSTYTEWTDNFDLDWYMNDYFRLKARLSYSERTDKQEKFTDPESSEYNKYEYQEGEGILKKGEAYSFQEKSSNLDLNVVLSYNRQFGQHYLSAVLGANVIESRFANESYSVIGFPTGSMDYISFGKEFKDLSPDGEEGLSRLVGAFMNLNYTWNNIYLLDLSGRYDGSSKFGSNKRYAPFWSVGIGWNIHNEKFFGGLTSVINHLKITANVGATGKASFEAYEAQDVYEYYKGQWYAGGLGVIMNNMGNTNLQWEKTKTFDGNFEIQFKDGLVSLDANYYVKRTKDLLADITLPLSSGFESYRDNLGELENKGFEISLRGFILRNKDVVLNVFGSIAHNKNVIKKIANSLETYNKKVDDEQDNYEPGWGESIETAKPMVQFKEGQSSTAIYAVKSHGINPMNGKEVFEDLNGNLTYKWSAANKIVCGDTEPKVSGAFGLNADWKGFNLNMSFLYQCGGQVYNQTLVDRVEDADLNYNVDRRVMKGRWKKPGDHTFFKDIKNRERTEVSSRFVQDENVLQLKSLSLSYSFPQQLIGKWGMERLKLNFLMEDVFRLSSVKRERGLDYPFARTFNLGLQVQF